MTMDSDKITIAFQSDPGRVRKHNEDSVAINADLGCVVLADGMGGYLAGEVASQITTEKIMAEITLRLDGFNLREQEHQAANWLQQAIINANRAILDCAAGNSDYSGMGTTVVSAIFLEDKVFIAHVGDSRLYRWRNQTLEALTSDHSVLQQMLDNGLYTPEEARNAPNKNLVTRALGLNGQIESTVSEHTILNQDLYLLCSDGLNDMLDDAEISAVLASHEDNIEEAASALIQAANDKGGFDNISVILAHTELDSTQPQQSRWWQRLQSPK